MKEIAENILIETDYEGVTVGAILTDRGVVMIDTPLSPKDTMSWRATSSRSAGGTDRLLVLLDEHYDRTSGASSIKCPIITHEKTALVLSGRPSSKASVDITGTIWEENEQLMTTRWMQPEITFTQNLTINWGDTEILLEHHPGPSRGSTWVIVPKRQVAFIGDTVTPGQPPFLANADIDEWLDALHKLILVRFRDYALISGRGELVNKQDIKEQQKFLRKIHRRMDRLASSKAKSSKVEEAGAGYVDDFQAKTKKEAEAFRNRLSYGFVQYFSNHYPKKTEKQPPKYDGFTSHSPC